MSDRSGERHAARRPSFVAASCIAVTAAILILLAGDHHGYDLLVYRGAIRTWLGSGDLYGYVHPGELHQGFTYPPFAAICLIPLVTLPPILGAALNAAATGIAIAWTTWVVVRPVAERHGQLVWLATTVATCLVCLLEPVRDTIGFGQVNLYLVALLLGDVLLIRQNSAWAGVGIGLAAAVKLTPALFVVYLFLSGRRRAAAISIATALGATVLAVLVAPSASVHFWFSALRDTSRVGSFSDASNQSLAGLCTRLLDVPTPPLLLWLPLVAAVLAIGLRRAQSAARSDNHLAALSLVGLTACLISPFSWIHHLWWVVPALVVLVADGLAGRRAAPLAGAVAVFAVFASSLPDNVRALVGEHPLPVLVGENLYTLAMLVMLLTLPIRADPSTWTAIRRSLPSSAGRSA